MRPRWNATPAALLLLVLAAGAARAQGVGINATGAAADTSAILDLSSTAKGFLPPRMTQVQRGAIVLPATGLVIYQTNGVSGLYWNAGTPAAPNWKMVADAVGGGGQWSVSGPSLYYSGGNIGVGTSVFAARLTVVDPDNGLRVQTDNPGGLVASFGGLGLFRVDAPGVAGGRLTLLEGGFLGLGRNAPVSRLDVLGGNWDVANGEGDFRIGDGSTRLKFGIATSGGGTGAATIMEHGPAGAYNVLALGSQGNKVLYVNGNSQRIGIGTDVPNAPLGFPPSLGKKITLYPGATGDVGIGVAGNRLQLYADNPNADVALGYDQAGVFNERFAVKPTGALAVNGNTGSAGQVLQSNGGASAATWVSPPGVTYNNVYQTTGTVPVVLNDASVGTFPVPGLTQAFSVPGNAHVLVAASVPYWSNNCVACGNAYFPLYLIVDGATVNTFAVTAPEYVSQTFTLNYMVDVGPGSHTVQIAVAHPLANTITVGGRIISDLGPPVTYRASMTLQVVPQ